jgi:hypothetical protein
MGKLERKSEVWANNLVHFTIGISKIDIVTATKETILRKTAISRKFLLVLLYICVKLMLHLCYKNVQYFRQKCTFVVNMLL